MTEEIQAPQPGRAAVPDADAWRRWLRAYPHGWRARHGEALAGVTLDVAEAAGRDRPTRREVADLVVSGLADRTRWALPSPRVTATASAFAVVLGAAIATTALVLGELAAPYRPYRRFFDERDGLWGPFQTTGPALYVLWLCVLGAVALGAVRVTRWLLAATAVGALALFPVSAVLELNRPPPQLLLARPGERCSARRAAARRSVGGGDGGGGGRRPRRRVRRRLGWAARHADRGLQDDLAWSDAYEPFPFYRGMSAAVVSALLVAGATAGLAVAALMRRHRLLLALLLVVPGTLPWTGWSRRPIKGIDDPLGWRLGSHGRDDIWLWLALLSPLLALAADRALRARHRAGADAAPSEG